MAESITKTVHTLDQVNPCLNWMDSAICKGLEGGPVAITLGRPEEKRTNPMNAKIHACFADLQAQGVITMPGRRVALKDYTVDEVKALSVIWFANERELEGRPLTKPPRCVVCPVTGDKITVRPSTVDFGKRDMSDFIEWLHALGADTGVVWSDPALEAFSQYRESGQ